MKNLFKLFGIIALVALIGFTMAACDSGGGGGSSGGGNLVLDAGWAWTNLFEGGDEGVIFRSNGTFSVIYYENSKWHLDDDGGTYTASGGNITTIEYGETYFYTYSVSGDTLNIYYEGEVSIYKKTNVGSL